MDKDETGKVLDPLAEAVRSDGVVLVCRPLDLAAAAKRLGVRPDLLQVLDSEMEPGWTIVDCDLCGVEVKMGIRQRAQYIEIIETDPTKPATILCMMCAVEAQQARLALGMEAMNTGHLGGR